MKKKLDIKFVIGLFTYLRQISLSVDRMYDSSWNEFVCYFKNGLMPSEVLNYLSICTGEFVDKTKVSKDITNLLLLYKSSKSTRKELTEAYNKIPQATPFKKLRANIILKWNEKLSFSNEEINTIYFLLSEFSNYLNRESSPDFQKEIVPLGRLMAYSCSIVELKISAKDVKKVWNVEHFNQSFTLDSQLTPLNILLGKDWLVI